MIQKTVIKTERFEILHYGEKRILEIKYGIHYIKGNHDAYFTITGAIGTEHEHSIGNPEICGCIHNEIKKHWRTIKSRIPKYREFIELHLSDTDGMPMYAVENGHYHANNPETTTEKKIQILMEHFRTCEVVASNLVNVSKDEIEEFVENSKERYKKEAEELLKELGL